MTNYHSHWDYQSSIQRRKIFVELHTTIANFQDTLQRQEEGNGSLNSKLEYSALHSSSPPSPQSPHGY